MFHLAVGSQVFLGAWFAQILNQGQSDNIGAFELQPPGGIGYFPVEIFRKPDGQLRLHGVLPDEYIPSHCNALQCIPSMLLRASGIIPDSAQANM